jgi:hypothetical protein
LQVGAALGLAIFSAIATSRTRHLLATHVPPGAALADGFHRALLAGSIFLVAAALIALRAANTRGEPVSEISGVAVPETAADAEAAADAVPGAAREATQDAVGSLRPERVADDH